MKFTKMHGLGNDYIYVNCFEEKVENPERVAKLVSERHFGIGSDGLILIKPSQKADFEMEMYNADGSRGAMCGNGIRCVAKYVYDHGMTDKDRISVDTASGVKHLELTIRDGRVALVKVDMGAPILEASEIPVNVEAFAGDDIPSDGRIVSESLLVRGSVYHVSCVSMGNPHCVTPVEDVEHLPIEKVGPYFERHDAFPDRVNAEFIRVLDRSTVQMRVWERGSGETWACGTGACAVTVACILNGWTDNEVTVKLRGGDLRVCWDQENNRVWMTGPAATVFEGEIRIKE